MAKNAPAGKPARIFPSIARVVLSVDVALVMVVPMKPLFACAGPLVLLLVALSGCKDLVKEEPTYAEGLAARPTPTTSADRRSECAYIRSEIARMQGIAAAAPAMFSSSIYAAAGQAAAQRNIAALETRASETGCRAAFTDAPPSSEETMSFDECFAKCKKLTDRSDGECFDSCK